MAMDKPREQTFKETLRELSKKKWGRALIALALGLFLIWIRYILVDIYSRAQIRYEIERKGNDYRSVESFDVWGGRAKIRYPFYWKKSSNRSTLTFTSVRYTGSINEMIFESLPNGLDKDRQAMRRSIESIPRVTVISFKEDATIRGEPIRIYRYGVGNMEADGYQMNIVAVFPVRALKVTLVQYYEKGPFIEDDIATQRMLNVLYGLEFTST
ncbi:MAG: hypothetical protein M1548_01805 [Actinobacteria bacterium]|nr:hypothetical protein [Actinomycetota bacterium]